MIDLSDRDAQPSKKFAIGADPLIRTSHTCYLDPADALVGDIDRRIAEVLGIPQSHSEAIQAQRYAVGQEFKVHSDYFCAGLAFSDAVAEEGGQRTWTSMIFLNEPEAGGATSFPFVGLQIKPRAGALLIWNNIDRAGLANAFTRHAGMPVEAGIKHVVTKWFRERAWVKTDRTDSYRS